MGDFFSEKCQAKGPSIVFTNGDIVPAAEINAHPELVGLMGFTNWTIDNPIKNAECNEFNDYFMDFFVDLLYNPEAIGVDIETSVNCGESALRFPINAFNELLCHWNPQEVVDAYAAYMGKLEKFPKVLEPMKEQIVNALQISSTYRDYPTMHLDPNYNKADGEDFPRDPAGHLADGPTSEIISTVNGSWSAPVPIEFLLRKDNLSHSFLRARAIGDCHITGGLSHNNSDQMNAMIPAMRLPIIAMESLIIGTKLQQELLPIFEQYYQQPTESNPIVSTTEYNHIAPAFYGPLKSNHSVPCPLSYTLQEREELCISGQEAVWGTEVLRKLEGIKKVVDPQNRFNCQMCVGFNRTTMMMQKQQL